MNKSSTRQSIKERLERLSQKDREAESRSICRRIQEHLPKEMQTICAFYPMPTEVDLRPLLTEWLGEGKNVCLPRTEGKAFTFRTMTNLEDLEHGPFRILEPRAAMPETDLATIDLVLLPGLGFDRHGNRLGRGNGGYDQWLEKLRNTNKNVQCIGVCFDCQLLNSIPTEPHDAKVDAIITPRAKYDCLPS